ncbi:hypothetical protein YC2023_112332 [Brassica napus]
MAPIKVICTIDSKKETSRHYKVSTMSLEAQHNAIEEFNTLHEVIILLRQLDMNLI